MFPGPTEIQYPRANKSERRGDSPWVRHPPEKPPEKHQEPEKRNSKREGLVSEEHVTAIAQFRQKQCPAQQACRTPEQRESIIDVHHLKPAPHGVSHFIP